MLTSLIAMCLLVTQPAAADLVAAQKEYAQMRASVDRQIADIEARRDAVVTPIRKEMAAKAAERDACPDFDCAERISNEIDRLNQTLTEAYRPFSEEDTRVRAAAVRVGHELALAAYAEELEAFLKSSSQVQLLKISHNQKCTPLGQIVPSDRMSCAASIVEFKQGPVFYRTLLNYGLGISRSPSIDLNYLDTLFSKPTEQFLQKAKPLPGEVDLLDALTVAISSQAMFYDTVRSVFHLGNRADIGFVSTRVERRPK